MSWPYSESVRASKGSKKVVQDLTGYIKASRGCIVVSVSLVLPGLGFPFLMVDGLIPVNLLLSFLGFALMAIGGILALTLYGEI